VRAATPASGGVLETPPPLSSGSSTVTVAAGVLDRVGAIDPPGGPLVVGLSGGRDSVCLLDVLARLLGSSALLAVHVHHGLRGHDADADARHCAAIASATGVALRVVRLPGRPAGPGSVAVWAREARADALLAAADAWGGPGSRVALGHTTTDQAETVLLRAISSPGARSLAGIRGDDPDRRRWRPLLVAGITRGETGAWCRARGLGWRDDPSNPTSPRGRVRAVLDRLVDVDRRAVGALVRTAELAREDDDALTALAARALRDAPAGPRIDAAWLRGAPAALGRRALRIAAERTLPGAHAGVGARLEDVVALLERGGPAALDVGDGARIRTDGRELWCEPTPARDRAPRTRA